MWLHLITPALAIIVVVLGLVILSKDTHKYRRLVWITTFLTFDLILFGAFTRLTDSGLGCPDWPGCYGQASPLLAQEPIRAAETLMPDGPVTWIKAWIEMAHRYFAMGVGGLITVLMGWAWWRAYAQREEARLKSTATFATALFVLVCLQGAFGAWTVTMKLQPVIVTIHLLLGMGLLSMLTCLGMRENHLVVSSPSWVWRAEKPSKWVLLAYGVFGLLFMQIALGGWVSTNYAVLACTDFPLCQGEWLPPMDFSHGFTLWRELGKTSQGDYLPFAALTAIHWVHRCMALVVFAGLGWLAYGAYRIPHCRRIALGVIVVMCAQFITGLSTILFDWPLAIAVAHNAGAALLVVLLTRLIKSINS